jgi:hypothetical protein
MLINWLLSGVDFRTRGYLTSVLIRFDFDGEVKRKAGIKYTEPTYLQGVEIAYGMMVGDKIYF